MTNLTKDKFKIIGFILFTIIVLWFVSELMCFLFAGDNTFFEEDHTGFAESLTEQQQVNKFYTEEAIKNKLYLVEISKCIENMSEEEYAETFFKRG